jgi:hypothetical protein
MGYRIGILLLGVLVAAGCARVPKPVSHVFSAQQQLEAAEHWRELAVTVLDGLKLEPGTVVHVSQEDRSAFGRAFSQFLRHEAMLRRLPVSATRAGALDLDWGVQIIEHNAARPRNAEFPGIGLLLAGLGVAGVQYIDHNSEVWQDAVSSGLILGGVLVEAANAGVQWQSMQTTDTELLINVVAKSDGTLKRNYIAVYYVNRVDKGHYWQRPVPWEVPLQLPTRQYQVVNR